MPHAADIAAPLQPGPAGHGRVPALDGLRGIAIALVLLLHFTAMEANHLPAWKWLSLPVHLGWAGVDLFFVLSGFLITGVLLRARGRGGYYRNFYARRALRIFPLYYAFLVAVLVVVPLSGRFEAQGSFGNFWWVAEEQRTPWAFWVYLGNFVDGARGKFQHFFLSVTWSLAIEEHFYLAWPLLLARVRTTRGLVRLCAGVAAGSALLRAGAVAGGLEPLAVYAWTPMRLDGLALGGLLAVIAREPAGLAPVARLARAAWGPLLAGVLGLAAARVALGALPQTIQFDPWMQAVGYPLVNALFAALLVLAVAGREGGPWRALLQQGWLQWLGRYSYAMYLFNLPVRWVLEQILGRPEDLPLLGDRLVVQALYYPAGFALTGVAAWASWRVLEGPCLRLKARFGGEAR